MVLTPTAQANRLTGIAKMQGESADRDAWWAGEADVSALVARLISIAQTALVPVDLDDLALALSTKTPKKL